MSDIASVIFALTFVIFRIGIFGYALLEFHYRVWRQQGIFPAFTNWPLTYGILLTFTAGWILQWFWLRQLLSKTLRMFKVSAKRED